MKSIDANELIKYFSEYLSEISSIIKNIKQNVYEMVDVSINTEDVNVYENISSIIFVSHHAFNDLKRI
jgi:hypothetical protein